MSTAAQNPNATTDTPEVDPALATMRERYQKERDKRLRPEGNDQYVEVVGQFAHYLDDPYVDAKVDRESLTDEVDVVVIGGGSVACRWARVCAKRE